MFELSGFAKSGVVPVQIANPAMDVGIARPDVAKIGLEMLDVDGIESDDGGEESDIGFGDVGAKVKGTRRRGQVGFDAVKRFEQLSHVLLVCFLGGCKAGFVDAVVDVVIYPGIGFVDLGLQVFGEQNDVAVFGGDDVVEFGVEHANDLGGFVRDNGLVLLVPEGGDGEASRVVFVGGKVQVTKVSEVGVKWIWGCVFSWEGFI